MKSLKGEFKDRFDERVGKKIIDFGSHVVKKRVVPDETHQISQALFDPP